MTRRGNDVGISSRAQMTRAEFLRLAAAGGAGLALAACAPGGGAAGGSPLTTVSVDLRLSSKVAGHHSPYFLGIDQGIFAKQGIDLKYSEGLGSADTAKVVGAGQHDIGYADLSTMARAVSEGVPVKAIYTVMQVSPLALAFKATSGIKEAKDLKGKTIAMSSGGAENVMVPAFLNSVGIDPKEVTFIRIQPGGTIGSELMLQGRADVAFTFMTDKPMQFRAEKQGIKVNTMSFTTYGVGTLNHGFFARTETLAQKPDLVKRFLRGATASWKYAIDHREAAIAATKTRFPDIDPEITKVELDNTIDGLFTPKSKGKPIGFTAPEDWETTITILGKFGDMKPLAPTAYYTNDFVPTD